MSVTAGQRALSAGLRALQKVHPSRWSFGGRSWTGVTALLRPDDPRQLEEPDAKLQHVVETSLLSKPLPEGGHYLRRGAASHRIIRVDHDQDTGVSTFILAASKASAS